MAVNHDHTTCPNDETVSKLVSAVWINGHPRGSLMTRMAAVEKQGEDNSSDIVSILAKLDELPTRILKIVLTISLLVGALITILDFLGPSLRKTMGLAAHVSTTWLAQSPAIDAGNFPRKP